MILTGIISLSAFFVANAVPFFKDLVSLIGALTSVPLTLLLPALYHRRVLGEPVWWPTKSSLVSYALVVFSLLFIATALIGAVDSIISDWEHHTGGFFSCH
jgi:amino acid permease